MSGVVTRVTFERDSGRRGIVAWSVSEGCDRVDIAVASSPDAIDHDHARTVNADAGRAVLDDMPPGRAYVSVAPSGGGSALIAGERNLGLLGPTNFRDLGGYVGAAGILRTPRWAMQGALVELERRYGGIDGYLTGPAGTDPSVPGALRALLLA